MKFTAQQLADYLGGTVEGNPEAEVYKLGKIEEGREGVLTFLANPKYVPHIYSTQASVVIVGPDFIPERKLKTTLVRVRDAYGSFAQLLNLYNQMKHSRTGIEEPCTISKSALVGDEVFVGAHSYIGENCQVGRGTKIYQQVWVGDNVKIGEGCIIYPGVRIYADCVIGNDVVLHSGCIVGADGFGFAPNAENQYQKVAQIGNVVIEDHVEIGANTAIDRATMGSTYIRKGVKLDNLIQIAHNVDIGENTVIAGQTGVAGSTRIGKNCMIGGQVGISGHLTIGDNVKIAAQSGIGHNVKDGEIIQGSPGFNALEYKKAYVYFRQLPELIKKLSKKNQ